MQHPQIGALVAYFPPVIQDGPKRGTRPSGIILAAHGSFKEAADESLFLDDHSINHSDHVQPLRQPASPGLYVFEGQVEPLGDDDVDLVGCWRCLSHSELLLFVGGSRSPWE